MALVLINGDNIRLYSLADGFGSVEENLLMENIYFNKLEIRSAKTIIDLGAHQGSFTIYSILNCKSGTEIFPVEPNPVCYQVLTKNLSLFSDTIMTKKLSVKTLNVAVGTENGFGYLQISRWSESSSLKSFSGKNTIFVKTIKIENLISKAKQPILVKMDIEGAECNILGNWLEKVDFIAIEPHGCEEKIKEILKKYGFCVDVKCIKIPSKLAKSWIALRPRKYTIPISLYRLVISSIFRPTVKIIRGIKG